MNVKTKLLLVIVCAAFTIPAAAQKLTFEFTASVSEIYTGLSTTVPDVSLGQSVTGWFSYDDSVTGVIDTSLGVSNRYNYDQIASIQVNVGDILISHLYQPVEIDVDNNQYDLREERNEDHFLYRFDTSVPQWGDLYCDVRFLDATALAFDSFALPSSFDLTEFDIAEFYFSRSITQLTVQCQIEEITFVPEPATLSLLAGGGLALLRRKKVA